MKGGCEYLEYRRLRAPRDSGAGLFEPAGNEIAGLVDVNLRRQANACYDLQGKCLSRLAQEARGELLAAARQWTATYRDVGDWAVPSSGCVFLAGHQPQMFHPGVWLKNFALSRLAEEHQAVGVNLLVDSDTIRSHSIRVPGGTAARPTVAEIPFDASGAAVPFEERRILDSKVFASFAERVQEQIQSLVARPLVGEYWRHVRSRARSTDRLGLCLAQARHVLEGEWGARTLELPQSAVCDSDSYRWFLCHLLHEAARFRRAHNEVAGVYRRAHHIRSLVHPVADLAEQDGWHEAPFWIWAPEAPRRRRLFVRRSGDTLRLTDRRDLGLSLPMPPDGDASRAVERLQEFSREGVRIRSRALITTMWARLALGELFIHGIGGAKYDQVTSALIARFFGLEPPAFLTVSGTLHLPVPHHEGVDDEVRRLRDRLRRLEFQPERYLNGLGAAGDVDISTARNLAEQKWGGIDKEVTQENYRERFVAIRRLNERLQTWVEPIRHETLHSLKSAEQAAAASSILTWREYGFCLFPGEELREFLLRLTRNRELGESGRKV
jgi:hypothetical protein